LATPNYQFERRQRDLAKKAKQAERLRQKAAAKAAAASGKADPGAEAPGALDEDGDAEGTAGHGDVPGAA
jgi:hypothetical protein